MHCITRHERCKSCAQQPHAELLRSASKHQLWEVLRSASSISGSDTALACRRMWKQRTLAGVSESRGVQVPSRRNLCEHHASQPGNVCEHHASLPSNQIACTPAWLWGKRQEVDSAYYASMQWHQSLVSRVSGGPHQPGRWRGVLACLCRHQDTQSHLSSSLNNTVFHRDHSFVCRLFK